MSGVCAKHDRYVQPGEVCPYCEPERPPGTQRSCVFHVDLANALLRTSLIDSETGTALLLVEPRPPPLMHSHYGPLRDLDFCPGCGKSGLDIMQAGETYKTHPCFRKAP